MAKSRTDELAERLHAAGLKKRVAKAIAEAQSRVPGRKPPTGADKALSELRSLIGDVGDRVTGGGSSKRSEAAKKAAATRKRNAAKRSASAKKGAKTRSSGSGSGRSRSAKSKSKS